MSDNIPDPSTRSEEPSLSQDRVQDMLENLDLTSANHATDIKRLENQSDEQHEQIVQILGLTTRSVDLQVTRNQDFAHQINKLWDSLKRKGDINRALSERVTTLAAQVTVLTERMDTQDNLIDHLMGVINRNDEVHDRCLVICEF